MDLYYDKAEGVWKEHKEPYATVEFPTEEDYNRFLEMVELWNQHHPKEE